MNVATPVMQPDQSSNSGFLRYRVLLGALLVQLILGTVYGYSIFWEPLSADIFPPVVTQIQADEIVAAGDSVADYTFVGLARTPSARGYPREDRAASSSTKQT